MSRHLDPEPPTDADAVFRNFMRHNLEHAAGHFGLTVTAPPVFGWRLRSIGAKARGQAGTCWLRVTSREVQWTPGEAWTGNADANAIIGLPKPQVFEIHEWRERDWREQRAECMTLLPGEPCSPTDVLLRNLELPDDWWAELRRSIDTLATIPTERTLSDQERVTARIQSRFGDAAETMVRHWTTAHGDLHWSNLMRPQFGILDWEMWGRGPAGIDAATLLCYSLLTPRVASKVRALFADLLDTPTGRVAQRYAAARLLRRIHGGDYPELAGPLKRYAASIVAG